MTSILALDLASRVGWAECNESGDISSGVVPLPTPDPGPCLSSWCIWLRHRLTERKPDFLVFEQSLPQGRGLRTTQATVIRLVSLIGITEMVAYEHRVKCAHVNVMTWRKHFTGKGRWKTSKEGKRAVVRMCRQLGFSPLDDNEADALGILDYAIHTLRVADVGRFTLT